jgi:hypothetical protein
MNNTGTTQAQESSEPKPGSPGTYYGELSPLGGWRWEGTGTPSDDWLEVSPQAAPAPGTAVAGTTTIDALFTTMFATRSGDLGAATYVWATPTAIIGTFPAGTTPTAVNGSRMYCRFEAGAPYPSSIRP